MRTINKTILIPYQKIDFQSRMASLEALDELEALLMISIITVDRENKRKTIAELIETKLNISSWSMPLVYEAFRRLIRTKTIEYEGSPEKIILETVYSVLYKIDKELISEIKKGKFVKRTNNIRKINGTFYEPIVENAPMQKINNPIKFDNLWKVNPISMENTKDILEDHVLKNIKKENENVIFFKQTNVEEIIYSQNQGEFEIDDNNKIFAKNSYSTIAFENYKSGKIDESYFKRIFSTSVDGIEYLNQKGIRVNGEVNKIDVSDKTLIIENKQAFLLFNNKVKFNIVEFNKEVEVDELFKKELTLSELIKLLIRDGESDTWKKFETIDGLEKAALNLPTELENLALIKHFAKKLELKELMSKYNHLIAKVFDDNEFINILKSSSTNVVKELLPEINSFIEDNSKVGLYNVIYQIINMPYEKHTTIFPKWKKEKEHKRFVDESKKIETKIEMLDKKEDVDLLLDEINKYNFDPIRSNVETDLLGKLKTIQNKLPIENSEKLKLKGAEIRFVLEDMVKKEKKLKFHESLIKAIKDKIIKKEDEKQIERIYKFSNQFHHGKIVFDEKLEKEINSNIQTIIKIAKKNNLNLKNKLLGGK